ncbi:hypothetical protein [Haloarchaeobius sp. TZWWS8]|uniref:hypothetical protein n=1 Tax=Haloarchaeobius sp. TZWWS8 TaxID=3446121 RepID=UPI003EBBF7BB
MKSLTVAATELRCTLRRVRDHPKSVLLRAALLTFAIYPLVGGGPLGDGSGPAAARSVAAGVWLFVAVTAAISAPRSLDDVRAAAAVLPAIGLRRTVRAVLVTQLVDYAPFVAIVLLAVVVTGATAGAPLAILLGLVAGLAAIATAVVVGTALGIGWGPLVARLPFVRRYPRIVVVVPILGVVVAVVNPDLARRLLTDLPPGWYADPFLLGIEGAGGDERRATAALGGTPVVLAVGSLLAEHAADRVWFGDDGRVRGSTTFGSRATAVALAVVAPVTRRPTRAVARRAWLRMLRNPRALVQLAIPPLILASVAMRGTVDSAVGPAFVVFLAAWSGGMTLTLNPLALEGNALPALLTTPVAGGQVVRGYVLAGVLGAVPGLLLAVAAASSLPTIAALFVVCATAWGLVVAASGAAVSTGLGFLLPSLDALADGSTSGPTRAAVLAYMLTMALVAAPGLGGLVALPDPVGLAAVAGDVVLLVAVGSVSYWYAGRQFETVRV